MKICQCACTYMCVLAVQIDNFDDDKQTNKLNGVHMFMMLSTNNTKKGIDFRARYVFDIKSTKLLFLSINNISYEN